MLDPATGDIKLELLTDQHIAALVKAVRAEGFTILHNVSTGRLKLEKRMSRATEHPDL